MKTGPNSVSLERSIEHVRGQGKIPTEEKSDNKEQKKACLIDATCSCELNDNFTAAMQA